MLRIGTLNLWRRRHDRQHWIVPNRPGLDDCARPRPRGPVLSGSLGLPFLFTAPPQLAFFDCAGVRLLLDVPQDQEFARPGSILYFAVEGIQQVHQALVARGVTFRRDPHLIAKLPDREVWMGFFDDTEGNTLALMEERQI